MEPLVKTEGSNKLRAGEHFRYVRGGCTWQREILKRPNLVVLVYTSEGGAPSRLKSLQMFALDYFDHSDETRYCGGGCL